MTDKQIIIDNVDVSGCESFCNGICCKVGFGDDASCKLFSDCHYKNWKRKEQECEELSLGSHVGGIRMFTPLKAQYTDRNGKIKNCIVRAFVNTDTGIKAVIEIEETHNLQEISVLHLKITDYENLARIWSKSNE